MWGGVVFVMLAKVLTIVSLLGQSPKYLELSIITLNLLDPRLVLPRNTESSLPSLSFSDSKRLIFLEYVKAVCKRIYKPSGRFNPISLNESGDRNLTPSKQSSNVKFLILLLLSK